MGIVDTREKIEIFEVKPWFNKGKIISIGERFTKFTIYVIGTRIVAVHRVLGTDDEKFFILNHKELRGTRKLRIINSLPDLENKTYRVSESEMQNQLEILALKTLSGLSTVVAPPTVTTYETDTEGKEIILTLDKDMRDPCCRESEFIVSIGEDVTISPNSITLDGSNKKKITLGFPEGTFEHDDDITMSYIMGSLLSEDLGILEVFEDQTVTNNVTNDQQSE